MGVDDIQSDTFNGQIGAQHGLAVAACSTASRTRGIPLIITPVSATNRQPTL